MPAFLLEYVLLRRENKSKTDRERQRSMKSTVGQHGEYPGLVVIRSLALCAMSFMQCSLQREGTMTLIIDPVKCPGCRPVRRSQTEEQQSIDFTTIHDQDLEAKAPRL